MSEQLRTLGQNVWLWRVILFKGFNGWFTVVGTSLCAANVFPPMTTTLLLSFIAGSKFIEGFMNQDLGKLKQEISAALDTTFLTRTSTTQFQRPQQTQTQTETTTLETSTKIETPVIKPPV